MLKGRRTKDKEEKQLTLEQLVQSQQQLLLAQQETIDTLVATIDDMILNGGDL